MKKRYIAAALLGAVLGVGGCECLTCGNSSGRTYYPTQGINAYQGQSVSSLFNANGAPNRVENLADGDVMWIYYTNYRPVGGGELISYDNPPVAQNGTTCTVKVTLHNDVVKNVVSNC